MTRALQTGLTGEAALPGLISLAPISQEVLTANAVWYFQRGYETIWMWRTPSNSAIA